MIYGTAVFLYAMANNTSFKGTTNYKHIFMLTVLCVIVTTVYLVWKDPIFHQVSYSVMVAFLLYETLKTCQRNPQIQSLAVISSALYGLGIMFWVLDNTYCGSLRSMRNNLHPSVHVMTQFHGLWHILTGLATNVHIVMSTYARSLHLKHRCSIKMHRKVWPYLCIHDEKEA